jgi:hypothetical protein
MYFLLGFVSRGNVFNIFADDLSRSSRQKSKARLLVEVEIEKLIAERGTRPVTPCVNGIA